MSFKTLTQDTRKKIKRDELVGRLERLRNGDLTYTEVFDWLLQEGAMREEDEGAVRRFLQQAVAVKTESRDRQLERLQAWLNIGTL